MLLSIILLSYNQEKFIIGILESIKNQIKKYETKKKSVQLIICDDGSVDKTLVYARKWLDENKEIFGDICILPSKKNKGTCKNWLKSINYIKGKYYKTIAADDLFADVNILGKLKDDDIYVFSYLIFKNGCIDSFATDYDMHYLLFESSYKRVKYESSFLYPFATQSWIIKSDHIDDELIKSMSKCSYIEDQLQWFSITRKNDLKISYYNQPIVLYRKSDDHIAYHNDSFRKAICDDERSLYKYKMKINTNIFSKWSMYCSYKSKEKKYVLFKYLDVHRYLIRAYKMVSRKRIKRYIYYLVNSYVELENGYILSINRRVKDFINNEN